jgi:hypothetical protein
MSASAHAGKSDVERPGAALSSAMPFTDAVTNVMSDGAVPCRVIVPISEPRKMG